MSSVLVKGMEMPQGSCEWVDKDCHLHRCKLLNGDDDCKMQEGLCSTITWQEQFANCPLIEVQSPHGRLIDADALNTYDVSPIYEFCVMGVTEEDIGLAETIIEAEGSEE